MPNGVGVRIPLPAPQRNPRKETMTTPQTTPHPDSDGGRTPFSPRGQETTPLWEDILIILAIISLWPAVFRIESVVSRILMYAAIPAMGWVMWRRVRRLRGLFPHGRKR